MSTANVSAVVHVSVLTYMYNENITTIVSSIAAAVTGPPQNVRNTARSSTTLNISWSPPLITQRYGTILRYNVSCLGSDMLQFNQTTDNSTFSARMVGLRPYTNYSCCISAITTVAEGKKACTNTITSEAGRYAVELKRLHFLCVHTSLFLFPPKHPVLLHRI